MPTSQVASQKDWHTPTQNYIKQQQIEKNRLDGSLPPMALPPSSTLSSAGHISSFVGHLGINLMSPKSSTNTGSGRLSFMASWMDGGLKLMSLPWILWQMLDSYPYILDTNDDGEEDKEAAAVIASSTTTNTKTS